MDADAVEIELIALLENALADKVARCSILAKFQEKVWDTKAPKTPFWHTARALAYDLEFVDARSDSDVVEFEVAAALDAMRGRRR